MLIRGLVFRQLCSVDITIMYFNCISLCQTNMIVNLAADACRSESVWKPFAPSLRFNFASNN